MFSSVIHGANNMAKPATKEVGELVPDPKVFQEFDISAMTGYRWDHSEELIALGWPPPIRIGQRKYRSRKALEAFKAGLMRRAIEQRRAS
jgi:hypothetical protein